ncbi:hypothetical protein NM208_g8572 [Fusarium decemcellulare]|uniref:Uncharacterized protein n=1 Tax=Fusarium decemcellulare TaxID=57161 RepID=A0ACC1S4V2_9HYPO|nr:hypothetical protein NM208_g8572 [Fusarium decemcellulare]
MADRRAGLAPYLESVAIQAGVEAWWYPVWTNQLEVYTDNYANAYLSVAPQGSLKRKVTGGFNYIYPDFMIFENLGNGERNLRLVMEVKKDQLVDGMADAMEEAEDYAKRAINKKNSPLQQNINRMRRFGPYLVPGCAEKDLRGIPEESEVVGCVTVSKSWAREEKPEQFAMVESSRYRYAREASPERLVTKL